LVAERPSHGQRLLWCLRHYAWVLVVCILALAAAPLMLAPAVPTYQADALVVARELTMSPDALPALAETVFDGGAVEASVTADPAVQDDVELIPDRLSVEAAEDSIALVVQARDANAATAVRMANLAADSFTLELNRAGVGVGEFVVQARAILPTQPLTQPRPEVRAAFGALAGLALGLGIIALLAVMRKPVITFEEVEAAAGVPLLGTVQLRRRWRAGYAEPLGVPGIARVTRGLTNLPSSRLLLVGPATSTDSSDSWIRDRLFVMIGAALSGVRRMRFEGPSHLVGAIQRLGADRRELPGGRHPAGDAGRELVLMHHASPLELIDPASNGVSVVAVAQRGVPQRALRDLAAEYAGGGLLGVVLVDVRPGGQRAGGKPVRAPAASRAPVTGQA
jgi:hypothetical protein